MNLFQICVLLHSVLNTEFCQRHKFPKNNARVFICCRITKDLLKKDVQMIQLLLGIRGSIQKRTLKTLSISYSVVSTSGQVVHLKPPGFDMYQTFYESSYVCLEGSNKLEHVKQIVETTLLLTAFIGTAAFNIGGCTIHHAFSLNKYMPIPYEPLIEQSPLCAKLENLQILVIDEVSMVYKKNICIIYMKG